MASSRQAHKRITAAQDEAVLDVSAWRSVAVQIVGTLSATISFEATVDRQTWVALNLTPSNSATDASSATAAGAWRKDISGFALVRARCSAYTSGNPDVFLQGGP
jgi:hypothetical protein